MEYDNHYESAGVGTAALTTGIIGTAGVGLGLLGNLLGNNGLHSFVSKETFDMAQTVAAKDSEIALLKSEANTENKITEIYKLLKTDLNNLERTQNLWNANQQVFNNQITNTVSVNSNNIAQLMALTKLVVPATSICPEPMARYNSYTLPTSTNTQ